MASSLRSFTSDDREQVLVLSRRALNRAEEQVGNPLWATRDELESELADWDVAPEETLVVEEEEEDGRVVGFGGVEISLGWPHADLFGPLVAPRYQGQKLGTELLEASIELGRRHEARLLIASVGARNLTGRMLLEHTGFQTRGSAKAVFRLTQEAHRPTPEGPEKVQVRRGEPGDLDSALQLYHQCFPSGVFPDQAWRHGLEQGTVYLAEVEGRPLAFLDIDPNDRWAYHIGVVESERSRGVGGFVLSRALSDYWESHPGETLGLSVEADNVPALRLLRRQGFAPLLVLQSYELAL